VRTGTSLGAALMKLLDVLRTEVKKTTPTQKGDYKPLVFLLTDGQPTDKWRPAAEAVRKANNPKIANIYAIGCGPDVDTNILREITDIVLKLDDVTPESFKKFFVWLSASVQTASTKLGDGTAPVELPRLPDGLGVAPNDSEFDENEPRQLFIHARCQKNKKPYLMRFARRDYDGRYEAIAAHPLEVVEKGDGGLLPAINASMLDGCPDCPYCGNPHCGKCPCGAMFCSNPEQKGPIICPTCNAELSFGGRGEDFGINQSAG
jgi:hypothetical protein